MNRNSMPAPQRAGTVEGILARVGDDAQTLVALINLADRLIERRRSRRRKKKSTTKR